MLLKLLKIENDTVVSGSRARKRTLAAIACVSVLSGCESLPEVPSYDEMKAGISDTYDKTVTSIDKAWSGDDAAAAADDEVVVKLDRPAVRRLQSRLNKLGYAVGPADGIMGAKTTGAIKEYQTAHNLPATGRTSLEFLEHLEASAVGGGSQDIFTSAPY
jgi:peptidoglycan hydrolase-like protein with peptidoglycan-binding domain